MTLTRPSFSALILTVVFLAVGLASVLVWAWLGRPQSVVDVPGGRFACLSYTPSDGNTMPTGDAFTLPDGLVEADIGRLKTLTNCVRTYSSSGLHGRVLPIADAAGMQVLLGIWIGRDLEHNAKEIDAALALASAHPAAVRSIVVGNEVLLRREMPASDLIEIIRSVKARTTLPVTYADVYDFWAKNPEVADAVDIVTIHVLPYWEDERPVGIKEVQVRVRDMLEDARSLFPGKPLQIGEIGWPSGGRTRGEAAPTTVNQARFLREFARDSHDLGVPYNIIEAMDQPWKRALEGTVGGEWGLLDAHRQAKFPLTGPVREWSSWIWGAACSLLGLVFAFFCLRPAPSSVGRIAATAGAGALGGGLIWAFGVQASEIAFGVFGTIWAIALWLMTAGGTVLLVRQASGDEPDPRHLHLWRWLVLTLATFAAFAMAVDGRYRDFVTLAFIVPTLGFVLMPRQNDDLGPSEAWMGLTLLVCGPLGVDSWGNLEALGWAGVCLALAFTCRRAIFRELDYFLRKGTPVLPVRQS